MTLAIDMVGTHLGSGTRTYNLNFCEYINNENIDQKIYIFVTRDYLKNIHEFFSESGERYCLMCWEDFIAVVDKDLRSSAEGLVNE